MWDMLEWKIDWYVRDNGHEVWREREAEEGEQWRREKWRCWRA